MQFFEYGKPDGIPLVFLLGTPHTGESVAELDGLAAETGVRLVCTTRPWYVDTDTASSFETCTAQIIRFLKDNGLDRAFAIGASGGGPFALHLASNHPEIFRACYLLAAMGDPDVFRSAVKSPHTQKLLQLFATSDYHGALAQLSDWGIPPALAHGVWADFRVLLGSWATIDLATVVPVYIHHGEDDDNAPPESIRALAAKLTNSRLRISENASHVALAGDKQFTEFRSIFAEVGSQAHLATAG
jgi:pimeloyl-ACP methyl ester carboxylesterase